MSCEGFRKSIDEFVDGRLGPEDERLLRAHCTECRECAAALASAESFVRGMSDHFCAFDAGDPRAAARRVVAAMPPGAPPRPAFTPFRLGALAAAA